MKYNSFLKIILFGFLCAFIATSCVKEGPQGEPGVDGKDGAAGAAGKDGADGEDANETCIICHAPDVVDRIAVEFQYSKHEEGEAAMDEAGNPGCTPCHAQEAFKYVVENNVLPVFELGANGKYTNKYAATPGTAYGRLLCGTCHSSIHKTYASSDMPALTTVAEVPMTMWGGTKKINITADGGVSNLCIKCHQPRPRTYFKNGNVVDYAAIAANPKGIAFNAEQPNDTNMVEKPGYRMHVHYGSVGAIYAGVGGVEFAGLPYTNTAHTTNASCKDCHMGAMYGTSGDGASGGHTFKAKGNLTTCNATGCHTSQITTASGLWANTRSDIKGKLDELAAKLSVNGVDIMNRNGDAATNLWVGLTTNNYDGYLNIMDMQNNPNGPKQNTKQFQNLSAPSKPNQYWSQADIDLNKTLPKLSLTNAQYGAILNFQLCLRDYSLGIHNYAYTKALLTNSLAALAL